MKTKQQWIELLQQLQSSTISSASDDKLIEWAGQLSMAVALPVSEIDRDLGARIVTAYTQAVQELRLRGYDVLDLREVVNSTPEVVESYLEDVPLELLIELINDYDKLAGRDPRYAPIAEIAKAKMHERCIGSC